MKSKSCKLNVIGRCGLALAGVLAAGALQAAPAIQKSGHAGDAVAEEQSGDDTTQEKSKTDIVIQSIEPASEDARPARKEVSWLGLSTEEASEALSAQLGLPHGAGLVIRYVTPDSPAAKAGLQKNDVLAELDGQSLVVPAQLRKLVQAHKPDDTLNFVYYRAGKKETASVTVGKTTAGLGMLDTDIDLQGNLRELKRQLSDLPIKDAFRQQMKSLKDSLGALEIDKHKLQDELRRSVEAARKAMDEALRQASNAQHHGLNAAEKALKDLEGSEALADNPATVTVRSTGKVKSLVKADDSGTIVIVASPKLHLTAHDKEGKLLFDGEIATTEQRDQVPHDLWEKVEPLVNKLQPKAEEE